MKIFSNIFYTLVFNSKSLNLSPNKQYPSVANSSLVLYSDDILPILWPHLIKSLRVIIPPNYINKRSLERYKFKSLYVYNISGTCDGGTLGHLFYNIDNISLVDASGTSIYIKRFLNAFDSILLPAYVTGFYVANILNP